MPVVMLHFRADNQPDLLAELEKEAKEVGLNPTRPARMRNIPLQEIIVGLGSAGAFTALFQLISNLLLKNKDRELIIISKGTTLTLKGHSLPEEKELLERLLPEFAEAKTEASEFPAQKGHTRKERKK